MTELSTFLNVLRQCALFDSTRPVTIARAPGRLDVMGGIADYSGSLVLQRPIAEATFAAAQPNADSSIHIVSIGSDTDLDSPRDRVFRMELKALAPGGKPLSYEQAQNLFRGGDHWAAYVAGVFLVLMRERGVHFPQPATIVISSSVPEGKGVASSAALEVAAMQALAGAFGVELSACDTALLCQKVENCVAGAACGVMDQMTSVCGDANTLLALRCQPAELEEPVQIPGDLSFWGLDSGERHAVSGSDYESVRAGAFMGYAMIAGRDARHGYLADIPVAEFERDFLPRLPARISGKEFLERYSGTPDTVTRVSPDRTYEIRNPTAHPVYERHRAETFRRILQGSSGEEQWMKLGALMSESHASYAACGLGSPGTDAIVRLVRNEEQGQPRALFGARITGGGSGGTVAILGRADAGWAVDQVAERYERLTSRRPHIFRGSSPGAAQFGTMTVRL
jgi:galactokinase